MNVVDSSGWLEYFADSRHADLFAEAIEDTEHLLVPVVCLYEVFKKILQIEGQAAAKIRAADMLKGKIIEPPRPSLSMPPCFRCSTACQWSIARFWLPRASMALRSGRKTSISKDLKGCNTSPGDKFGKRSHTELYILLQPH